eukprot:scaffold7070_cov260-Pinguiococcus_pyrenoidosus.AAC.1
MGPQADSKSSRAPAKIQTHFVTKKGRQRPARCPLASALETMSDQDDFELVEEAPSGATQDPAPCQDLVSATAADENSFLPAGFKPAAFVGTTETCRDGAESLTQALHRLLHGRTWSSLAKPQGIVKDVARAFGFGVAVKGPRGRYIRCSRAGVKQKNYKSKHVREWASICCGCPFE